MSAERRIILNFHGIGEPHAEVDTAEKSYWISEAFFTGILDLALAHPDADRIVWTFDDGNRSDLTIAARLLQQRGRHGLFFLLAGRFDDPRYLSPADARELVAMGMTVGLHGRDHVDWRRLDAAQLDAETVVARRGIADAIGRPVDTVAIPFGAYDHKVIRHLVQRGFRHIYTSDGGPSDARQRIRSRTSIRGDMSIERVAALIEDRLPWRRKLRRAVSTTLRRHVI